MSDTKGFCKIKRIEEVWIREYGKWLLNSLVCIKTIISDLMIECKFSVTFNFQSIEISTPVVCLADLYYPSGDSWGWME